MQTFETTREAKEFLAGRIAAEAEREGEPLAEVEEKMLYFSETACSLPDMMEVNEVFDRDYDWVEYEEKIGGLAQRYVARVRKADAREYEAWKEAVKTIRGEDHYLLVLIDGPDGERESSRADRLKLVVVGLLLAVVALLIIYVIVGVRDGSPVRSISDGTCADRSARVWAGVDGWWRSRDGRG